MRVRVCVCVRLLANEFGELERRCPGFLHQQELFSHHDQLSSDLFLNHDQQKHHLRVTQRVLIASRETNKSRSR